MGRNNQLTGGLKPPVDFNWKLGTSIVAFFVLLAVKAQIATLFFIVAVGVRGGCGTQNAPAATTRSGRTRLL